jgi:hypothetical protein
VDGTEFIRIGARAELISMIRIGTRALAQDSSTAEHEALTEIVERLNRLTE